MIFGERSTKTTLDWIRQSPITFHLTGSRFFGTDTEESDWDFFTQDLPGTRTELHHAGFKLDSESYPNDTNFVAVYAKDNVHVQLVPDVRMKKCVQEQIRSLPKLWKLDKEECQQLWYIALKLYRNGMKNNTVEPTL
jgi:hypothetical protein